MSAIDPPRPGASDVPEGAICVQCGKALTSGFPGPSCPACLFLGGTHPPTEEIEGEFTVTGTRAKERVDAPYSLSAGSMIGPYRIVETLGEGGFGVVYRALQHEPIRREVALKLIKPDKGSREVLARFEAERRALALMEHPNIAAVLDAGTAANGQPYFVMELVRGQPITTFCDERRLTLHQRLELFIPVCQAIQHAHQKSVLHRDLKPSNILVAAVDGQPLVKVIDFGVAKALGQEGKESWYATVAQTLEGMVVGTPQYMSPEQAGAELDLDTRSDVYTLGVILYELLCGETPLTREAIRRAAFDEMLRCIREEEPARPSSRLTPVSELVLARAQTRQAAPGRIGRELRGDLDWIALRALEKERERRYESAAALAADIQRHLNDEPVEAGPPSAWYQFWKFARRNRLALSSAASIALLLVAGIVLSTWQAVRATRAEHYAQQQRDRADAVRLDLIKTAPTFIEVATTNMRSGQFEKALENTRYALHLAPKEARYRLQHANLLQVLLRLKEAVTEYEEVKHLTTEKELIATAEKNLLLCQELDSLEWGSVESERKRMSRLCDALLVQDNRMIEAGYIAAKIGRDAQNLKSAIIEALSPFRAQKNWSPERLGIEPTGTFFVDLSGLEIDSLDPLMYFPISRLYLNKCRITRLPDLDKLPLLNLSMMNVRIKDIKPLRGMKLRELNLYATNISDLSPLKGIPLEQINLVETEVVDLSPLRGAPLERIYLPRTVSDISPLMGAPLNYVSMACSQCADLSPLRGSPLDYLSTGPNIEDIEPLKNSSVGILDLSLSTRIRDYTPLLSCKNLQDVKLPEGADVSQIRTHPSLVSISIREYNGDVNGPYSAKTFWTNYDEKLRLEEKQLRDELTGLQQKKVRPDEKIFQKEGILLHHLADVLRKQMKLDEARKLADEAINFYRVNSGLPVNEISHAWQVLAAVQNAQGDLEGANNSHREALRIQKPKAR